MTFQDNLRCGKKNVEKQNKGSEDTPTSQACGTSCPVITKRIKAWPISDSDGHSFAHFKKSLDLHNRGAGPSSFWASK
jgi:hypothetical protein